VLAGLTRTLAFSRPLSGTEWAALPLENREREARAFHARVLRLFHKGIAIRCPVVAKVSPTARGLKVERFREAKAQDQGLLQMLEAAGGRLSAVMQKSPPRVIQNSPPVALRTRRNDDGGAESGL
jgi:hypothetical protein